MGGLLRIFLYLLGIFWVAMGSLMVFVPDLLKTNVFAKLKGIPLKKFSVVPIVISILLFLSASSFSNAHSIPNSSCHKELTLLRVFLWSFSSTTS